MCLSGSQSGRLEKLILDANPLLEAFGNAKTIRNNNSSRFGKFIEIHYSQNLTVSGGLFYHYLLEKSRICTQSRGERNYHIFYQLCACLPQDLWSKLELNSPDKFHYLNNTDGSCTQYFCQSKEVDSKLNPQRKSQSQLKFGAIQDQLIDDMKCYEQTSKALANFGVTEEQKFDIYSIVAAVLHLGNVSFTDEDDSGPGISSDKSSGSKLKNKQAEQSLATTARLMGLDKDLLQQSLLTRIMSTTRGGHKGTVYMVQLSVQQAQAARDALAKAIYSKLFDYIVTKIVNKSIPNPNSTSQHLYIGVLDVAGFEYFQHNSFEQFLINFCNEKLQQFFNERILKEEQNIYEKEGLNLRRVEFIDNQDCIQLLESRATGIFDLLDEESKLPKPNAQHFTQSVHQANKAHFRLAVPRMSKLKMHRELRDDEGFLIKHFAGAVCYETQTFIEKNNDALHASLKNLMLEANNELLKELFTDQQQPPGGNQMQNIFIQSNQSATSPSNKLNFISVGTTFRSQLNDLMSKLKSTGSHFIRCIKPNSDMVAHKFEGASILSQLHCSGMDSVLELMQQGYPSRSSFNDLYAAYKRFLPQDLARLDSHLFCRALFKVIGLSDSDFCFGSSKVFFRPGKFAEFDQIIRSDSEHVAELVKKVSKWLLCSRWRKAQYCCLSVIKLNRKIIYRRNMIIKLQKNWRMANVINRLKFRLTAIKQARQILLSLQDFERITEQQLKSAKLASLDRQIVDEQTQLLKKEIGQFIESMTGSLQREAGQTSGNTVKQLVESKVAGQQELDKLMTKRDLLIRSIKDKIAAKQKELLELEQRMSQENKRREQEELAKRKEDETKQQRAELELRRQEELRSAKPSEQQSPAGKTTARPQLVDSGTDPMSLLIDQEQRDYEVALRLAHEHELQVGGKNRSSRNSNSSLETVITRHQPLAPSENANDRKGLQTSSKFDLTKWKYSDLRDTINTSCDLELLEACKREFHRRLKVYHAWRAMNNSRQLQGSEQLTRAPSSVMENGNSSSGGSQSSLGSTEASEASQLATRRLANEQRYFRIPFVKSTQQGGQAAAGQRGWWFAHFDGQWIARQLEIHPDKKPILLVAGKDDIEMCELSLKETRLTSKRGAEILPQEFEEEWQRHGGKPYHSRNQASAQRPARR